MENLFVSILGNKVKNISSLIEKLWKKFGCPGHFTLNFLRKAVSTMANEIGNEKDIETIDRYIQELSKRFKSNFNNIFCYCTETI